MNLAGSNSSSRLFKASCVALVVTAMSFALRGAAAESWAQEFHLSNEQIGWINATAFWGFTLAMVFGGPLCDTLGLGRIVGLAFIGHAVGIALTVFAWNFWSLFIGTLLYGIANGSVEAACNPLIATIFASNKTTKLNHFHVWFPGGVVIGGLASYALGQAGFSWRVQFASTVLPLLLYGYLFIGQKFPRTERVEQGISMGNMFAACARPGFLLMAICMMMTAATELGPGQWIPNILSHSGVSGILVLVWITGLMAVGRQIAGPFVHKLSPMGMLLMSAILSAMGLYLMSKTTGGMLFVSATIFAFGVCFFWPTMLGYVSEKYPNTGALGLAIMGGAGMLSASYMVPVIGKLYDRGILARLPPGLDVTAATIEIQSAAGLETLGKVALLPGVLALVFAGLLVLNRRGRATGVRSTDA